MNEVEITQVGAIKCDFDSAKNYLAERLSQYTGIIFTEESKKDAKNTVAELRKEKKEFADRVKEVKKEYMRPFEEFYAKASEIIEMYDDPINFINSQVADFEAKRIEEKKNLIKDIYSEMIDDMMSVIPLDRIYDSKWENATCNQKQIRKDMMEFKEKVKSGIRTINRMESEVRDIAMDMYLTDYDLEKALDYIAEDTKRRAMIIQQEQERMRIEMEERIRAEERARIEAEIRAEEEKQIAVEEAKAEAFAEASEELIENLTPDLTGESNLYEYRMSLTDDAKQKLEMYMDSVGIEWEMM